MKDQNGDEADGKDETLVPLDYQTAGQVHTRTHPLCTYTRMYFIHAGQGVFACLLSCYRKGASAQTRNDTTHTYKERGSKTFVDTICTPSLMSVCLRVPVYVQIRDDDIFKEIVCPLPKGCQV